MTVKKYDSKAERAFHDRHPELINIRDSYSTVFKDGAGQTFRAKPDFFDPNCTQDGAYIEFKCHQLNNHLTKADADEKLLKVQTFKNNKCMIDTLKHGWNHSYVKQSIVQNALAKKGINIIVVFKDGTKISTQSKNRMQLANLNWVYESDYFEQKVA